MEPINPNEALPTPTTLPTTLPTAEPTAAPETAAHDDLIRAVRALETRSTSTTTKLALAAGSLAAFALLGMTVWNGRLVWMLILVLLVHEAGHFFAMRWFGYRDVKMFFIPLMGAAVSGRHFNVATWKKAIVYLAGPVPGIVLSIPMLILGMRDQTTWLIELGGLSLGLNVLNLLPLMPLDGGWIMHLTVFSRSPRWELVSRVAAIAVMLVAGIALGDGVLPMIAVFLALSIPMSFRIAKLVDQLRGQPVAAPVDDHVPDAAITRIADGMSTTPLAHLTRTQKASLIVQVYESLVVRPPGLAAMLAIWLMYAGSFAIAIGGGLGVWMLRRTAPVESAAIDFPSLMEQRITLDANNNLLHLGQQSGSGGIVIVQSTDAAMTAAVSAQVMTVIGGRLTIAGLGDLSVVSLPPRVFDDESMASAMDWKRWMNPSTIDQTPLAGLSDAVQRSGIAADRLTTHVVDGVLSESIELWCTPPTRDEAQRLARTYFQSPLTGVDDLPLPAWVDEITSHLTAEGAADFSPGRFAAHVSGSVDDRTGRLRLHVHRAGDFAAAVFGLVRFLDASACQDIELVFVVPDPPSNRAPRRTIVGGSPSFHLTP